MEKVEQIEKPVNAKGAAIFKRMLDDKKALLEHSKQGGKMEDFNRDKSMPHTQTKHSS